jgi:ribosomal protein S18 acetylase RimI-like enzyme
MAVIRVAGAGDLKALARQHQESFPAFFLTTLGAPFLWEYYDAVRHYPGGILLLAADGGGEAVGFVAGFLDPPGFYSALRRRWYRLVIPLLGALFRHPAIVGRVLAARSRVSRSAEERVADAAAVAELSSLAVATAREGRGQGRQLVDAFVAEARRRGARRVVLTTDAHDNDRVNLFYARSGFVLERQEEAQQGRLMNHYRLDLVAACTQPD